VYDFRMMFVGYLEGIGSERGIAWRRVDLDFGGDFLGHGPPDRRGKQATMGTEQPTC